MEGISGDFEYKNGVWRAAWHTRKDRILKVLVMGGADFMQSQSVPVQLQNLMNAIDDSIDKASTFASDSEYREDISFADGIVANSVVVSKWDDLKIWFSLRGTERLIGVRMHKNEPVDVFCEV